MHFLSASNKTQKRIHCRQVVAHVNSLFPKLLDLVDHETVAQVLSQAHEVAAVRGEAHGIGRAQGPPRSQLATASDVGAEAY